MALLIPGVGIVDAEGTLLIPGVGLVEQSVPSATLTIAAAEAADTAALAITTVLYASLAATEAADTAALAIDTGAGFQVYVWERTA